MRKNKYRIVDEQETEIPRIAAKDIEGKKEAQDLLEKIAENLIVSDRRWKVAEQNRDSFLVQSVTGIKHNYYIEKQEDSNA